MFFRGMGWLQHWQDAPARQPEREFENVGVAVVGRPQWPLADLVQQEDWWDDLEQGWWDDLEQGGDGRQEVRRLGQSARPQPVAIMTVDREFLTSTFPENYLEDGRSHPETMSLVQTAGVMPPGPLVDGETPWFDHELNTWRVPVFAHDNEWELRLNCDSGLC